MSRISGLAQTVLLLLLLTYSSLVKPVSAGLFQRQDDSLVLNQTVYRSLYRRYSDDTPRFNEDTLPINREDSEIARLAGVDDETSSPVFTLEQEDGVCAPGSPCVNGACCSGDIGLCGYGPDFCGQDVCISNCDAQAQCGPYAPDGQETCPLNVCCSIWGFCGTTDEFCGENCNDEVSQCGPPPEPDGKAMAFRRSIGYYESWATTRPCDKVFPEDLDVEGLTHLNFAFAFFHPTTFEMVAMDANAQSLLRPFTEIKATYPKLQTWIAIGGWSFNDPGNTPDTRMAFSDMARTAANRATFIQSLINFMDNYGFDGADIDWEYPGAEDRGGRPEDTENFVDLCREMKAAFGRRYGLSVTLPASFWYLRHFDVAAMEPHVDWLNVMTYDIHGVWDSSNKWTGPYARPHTNLTEIDEALSLLWRSGVHAANVVLGLAYYGRSFTLTDPSCTSPGCRFREGGREGECSKASGVLTVAEIQRIQDEQTVDDYFDADAAVRWMTWDSDQWVSYEDEQTFQLKLDYASRLGLGGTMIWAVDQGIFSVTNKLSTGIIALEMKGVSLETREEFLSQLDAQDSCYVSFCGEPCQPGYAPQETMRGTVGTLGKGTACDGDDYQTLCCATGTFMGRCDWYGWRGQGLSCYGGGCPALDVLITQNSNWFFDHAGVDFKEDKTCNGGLMAYCCRGFRPSSQAHKDVALVQPHHIEVHDDPAALAKRDFRTCLKAGVFIEGGLMLTSAATGPPGWLVDAIALGTIAVLCVTGEEEASSKAPTGFSGVTTRPGNKRPAQQLPGGLPPAKRPKKGQPKQPTGSRTHYGRYQIATWPPGTTTCQVTYTCEYGLLFDQVCDNQRWAIDQILSGLSFFHYDEGGNGNSRTKQRWSSTAYRHQHWYRTYGEGTVAARRRCEIDEFPMNSLRESMGFAKQALRAIDGDENGDQGMDFMYWLSATWYPCSTLLGYAPAINWDFDMGALPQNDGRRTAAANEVIKKYGFDSTSGMEPCYATYTPLGAGAESAVSDHGFRVHSDDPLFDDHNWPEQTWHEDPETQNPRPTSVNSANWVKRGEEYAGLLVSETTSNVPVLETLDAIAVTTEPPALGKSPEKA